MFHTARFLDCSRAILDALEAFERDSRIRVDLETGRSYEQYLRQHGFVLNDDGRRGGWEGRNNARD